MHSQSNNGGQVLNGNDPHKRKPQVPTQQPPKAPELLAGAIIFQGLEEATKLCHEESTKKGWYNDPRTGEKISRNRAEMLCLIHSEVSEVMESERKGGADKHLSHRPAAEVELADVLIRIFDYAGYCGYDVASAVLEKVVYNRTRPDHNLSERSKEGGKKF